MVTKYNKDARTLIGLFNEATALLNFGLAVQRSEGFSTLGDTRVEKHYSIKISTSQRFWFKHLRMRGLTARDDNPNKIHEEVVSPEIISLWPTVVQTLEV